MLGRIKLEMMDINNGRINEYIGYFDGDVIADTEDAQQLASDIEAYAQGVCDLTTNSYIDTIIEYEASLNQIVNANRTTQNTTHTTAKPASFTKGGTK